MSKKKQKVRIFYKDGKTIECSECHEKYTVRYVEDEWFCRHCGADMREPEDIPMEYFESGGR